MNSIFDKYTGQGKELRIGEDTFILKPLTTIELPLFFKVMRAFASEKPGTPVENIIAKLDDTSLNAIRDLIDTTLKVSYPNVYKEDSMKLKEFGLRYMNVLLPAILELNTSMADNPVDERKLKALEALKEKVSKPE